MGSLVSVGDGFEAAVDVVAGAHGAGEEIDGVGKVLFELGHAAARLRVM